MATDNVMAAILEVGTNLGFILKEKQIEAIDTFVRGNGVFVSLPTGYGKSIIYASLPSVFDIVKGRLAILYYRYYLCVFKGRKAQ